MARAVAQGAATGSRRVSEKPGNLPDSKPRQAGAVDAFARAVVGRLAETATAREAALAASRKATRSSANAVRALHRGDRPRAEELMADARTALDEAEAALEAHPSVRWAGFVHDAEKEYAEARITHAVLTDSELPGSDEVRVTDVAWLHGVAEAIGELRRRVLDLLRKGDLRQAEVVFEAMEAFYDALGLVDFPNAMTAGLRRAADADRGILERTRADLTMAAVQGRLETAISDLGSGATSRQ